MHRWKSFVAIGDSFTEGLNDPGPNGQFRGWADRLAELLTADQPEFRYANLAVRGKYVDQVLADQLPFAVASGADLVTFCAGGNDILRPSADPDAIAERYEAGVAATARGGQRGHDLHRFRHPADPGAQVRARPGRHLQRSPARHRRPARLPAGGHLVHAGAPGPARLEPGPAAPLRRRDTAGSRCAPPTVLDVTVDADWDEPWPPMAPPTWAQLRRSDWEWTREHFLPWVGRHVRGRSSGDDLPPKRPGTGPAATLRSRNANRPAPPPGAGRNGGRQTHCFPSTALAVGRDVSPTPHSPFQGGLHAG